MLVLTRRINETIIIQLPDGHKIKVQVTSIVDGNVRLGFEAPIEVKIFREELV